MKNSTFECKDVVAKNIIPLCIMGVKQKLFNSLNNSIFTFDKTESLVDIEEYVQFLKKCGFKMEVTKVTDEEVVVELNPKDYANLGEYMVSFTAIRYCVAKKYIAEIALKIKKEKPKIQYIKCLQMAHHINSYGGYYDGLHELVSGISKLIPKDEYEKRVKEKNVGNMALHTPINTVTREHIHKVKDDYTALFKLLK